jgi:hypothetical protein
MRTGRSGCKAEQVGPGQALKRLEVGDLRWAEPSGCQVTKGCQIAVEAAKPVDVRFRRYAANQILKEWADDKTKNAGPEKGALARKVNRIGNLRIAHAYSSDAAGLGAKVHPAGV